ncbi:hypothetical protein [Moorena sp. SIO3I6]|uniref:hypothetical protein n=1 Tax=Moorena sp. SIO3I6 TaxID=2607831 RepID=UPI0013F78B14|nr:hypothetical protein [Moorena sp. SIO3I6]NEP23734.1 hypothetical protein [Moorena sp. SIO3I6]
MNGSKDRWVMVMTATLIIISSLNLKVEVELGSEKRPTTPPEAGGGLSVKVIAELGSEKPTSLPSEVVDLLIPSD